MKKFSKIFVGLFLTVVAALSLASCSKKNAFNGTAKDIVNKILLSGIDRQSFTSDFQVPATVTVQDYTAEISWTSQNESHLTFVKGEKEYTAKVVQPEIGQEDVAVDFEASVTYNGDTAKKAFKILVEAKKNPKQAFIDFYENTTTGSNVTVEGYISHKGSCRPYSATDIGSYLWVEDVNDFGGYYVYNSKFSSQADYDALVEGAHVKITGELDEYNGARQIKKPTLEILEGTKAATVENITSQLVTLAEDAKAEKLHTANLVKVEGLEVKDVTAFNEGKFDPQTLIVAERAGKTYNLILDKYAYSDNYQNKTWNQKAKDLAATAATFQVGDYLTVEGLYGFFGSDAQICIKSLSKDAAAPQLTDKELAVSSVKSFTSTLEEIYSANATIALPVNTDKVTYEVSLKDAANANIKLEAGNLVITLPETDMATNELTVKATVGSETYKSVVKLQAKALTTFEKYQLAAKGDVLTNVEGVIINSTSRPSKDKTSEEFTVLVQNDEGVFKLFVSALSADKDATAAKLLVGNKINVASSTVDLKGGYPLLQVTNDNLNTISVVATAQTVPTPFALTEDLLKDPALKAHAFKIVTVTGTIKIEEYVDNRGKTKTNVFIIVGKEKVKYWIDSTMNTGTLADVKLDAKTADGTGYENEGKTIEFTGVLGFYNGFQFNPTGKASITIK